MTELDSEISNISKTSLSSAGTKSKKRVRFKQLKDVSNNSYLMKNSSEVLSSDWTEEQDEILKGRTWHLMKF